MTQNIMKIDGHDAVVTFDPEIGMLRGEFVGLNGGADFYASSVEALQQEGRLSLKVFLDMCEEQGIEPFRKFSGKFNVRLASELHEAAVQAARAENKSLNEWVAEAIDHATKAG